MGSTREVRICRASEGFGRHGHRDMEILSCVLSGTLAHEESTGRVGVPSGTSAFHNWIEVDPPGHYES